MSYFVKTCQHGFTPKGVLLLERGLHKLRHQNQFLETTSEFLLVYHTAFLPLLL